MHVGIFDENLAGGKSLIQTEGVLDAYCFARHNCTLTPVDLEEDLHATGFRLGPVWRSAGTLPCVHRHHREFLAFLTAPPEVEICGVCRGTLSRSRKIVPDEGEGPFFVRLLAYSPQAFMVRPSLSPTRRIVPSGTVLAWLGSLGARVANWPRKSLAALSFASLVVIGLIDYFTGYEISVLIFYLLPVSLAAWFVNRRFSFLISFLSVGTWIAADVGAGATYANKIVFGWNAMIILGLFLVVAFLLGSLRTSLRELENRVRQRTAALTQEIAERARLEIEVLEISEREQRRIGHDLHDSLGQHLTAAALAGQVLGDHLIALKLDAEVAEAERLVGMIEESIELTRGLARGLSPVTLETEGLKDALTELADSTTAQFYLLCQLQSEDTVQINDPVVAMHLYRIAQEAISNAVRHGCASQIHIVLVQKDARQFMLSIEDDGRGLPPPADRRLEGQGLRIMKHRATMIGAELEILPAEGHGTIVRCVLDPIGQRSIHPSEA